MKTCRKQIRVNVIATFEMSVAPVGLIVIDCRLASIGITRSAVNPMPSIMALIPVPVIVPEMLPIESRVTSFHLPASLVPVAATLLLTSSL